MNSKAPSSPSVLVSGASIAGLTTAYGLARYGFDVTVVERASHRRPSVDALDVRGPALEEVERKEILVAIRDHSTKLTGIAVEDANGDEVFRSTQSTLAGGRLDRPDVEILRDDLCRVLHEAVGNQVAYLYGDFITYLAQDESGVDVTFGTARPRRFELETGADGVGSGVRRIAFGHGGIPDFGALTLPCELKDYARLT